MSGTTPSRPLCVAQLLPALNEGGVERGTLEIAAALCEAGHRALVVSAGGVMVEELRQRGGEHITLPVGSKSPRTLLLTPTIRALLRAERVDILHLRSRLPAWIGYLAWRGMPREQRPRLVTTVHGLYSVNWYSAIMTRGERVIAVSNAVRRYLLDNYPKLPPERIRVIHRGVDDDRYFPAYRPDPAWRAAWRSEQPQLQGAKVITLAGRITRLKGHPDFFELIARLRQRGLAVHGLVVGGDSGRRQRYADQLKAEVQRRSLPVSLIGRRNDLREIFACSDLVVSMSAKPESFGRTVLEALALGTPVVGYGHGGVGEILAAMFPEGAVPAGDIDAAVRAAERICANDVPVTRRNPFPLARMLEATLELYGDLRV